VRKEPKAKHQRNAGRTPKVLPAPEIKEGIREGMTKSQLDESIRGGCRRNSGKRDGRRGNRRRGGEIEEKRGSSKKLTTNRGGRGKKNGVKCAKTTNQSLAGKRETFG